MILNSCDLFFAFPLFTFVYISAFKLVAPPLLAFPERSTLSPMEIRCREESSGNWETVALCNQFKPAEYLRGLASLQLVGVGPRLFVIIVEDDIYEIRSSSMSCLRLSEDGKSGEWEFKGAVSKDIFGELGRVYGAFSVEI